MSENFDIFLSYAWDQFKPKVEDLHEELKKDYKIWIDKEQMINGNVLAKMQDGINDSKMMICCLTTEYQERKNTMLELGYAFSIPKPILFLHVEDIQGVSYSEILSKNYSKVAIYIANQLMCKITDVDSIKKAINEILAQSNNNNKNIVYGNSDILPQNLPVDYSLLFIENGSLFDEIDQYFKNGNTVVICGHPGTGKTTHAIQYGYSRFSGTVRVVYADTEVKMENSFREMAELMSIQQHKTKSIDLVLQEMNKKFKTFKSPVLFIFDNVEEGTYWEKYHDSVKNNVFYIITTRNLQVFKNTMIELKGMDKEDAEKYLKNYIKNEEDIKKLLDSQIIGSEIFPYRIEQIAKIIEQNPLFDIDTIINYENNGAFKYEIELFKEIKQKSERAVKILNYLAFLDPDEIEPNLLTRFIEADSKEIQEDVKILEKYALVKINKTNKTLYLHRLTQIMAQKQIKKKRKEKIVTRLLEILNENTPEVDEIRNDHFEFKNIKSMINHAIKIDSHDEFLKATHLKELAELCHKIGNYHKLIILKFDKAIFYYKRSIELNTNKEDISTANTLNHMAGVYVSTGVYTSALEYYNKALVIIGKICKSEEHPLIADILNNMANVYQSTGDYTRAFEYYNKSLLIKRKIYESDDNPSIADILNNMASLYLSTGDFTRALEYYNKALVIARKMYKSDDNPSIADILNNMAIVYKSIGDYTRALEYYNKALVIMRKIYETDDHPSIANTLANMAAVYKLNGDDTRALEYFDKSLVIMRKIFESDVHPSIAGILNNMAIVYKSIGDYTRALVYYNQSLLIKRKIYESDDNPSIADTLANMATVYKSTGDYTRALEYCNKALVIMRKSNKSDDHPSIADTLEIMAIVYQSTGDYTTALEYHNKALVIMRKIYETDDHPSIADTLTNMATVYLSTGDYTRAFEYYNKSLLIFRKVFGNDDHPSIKTVLKGISKLKTKMALD